MRRDWNSKRKGVKKTSTMSPMKPNSFTRKYVVPRALVEATSISSGGDKDTSKLPFNRMKIDSATLSCIEAVFDSMNFEQGVHLKSFVSAVNCDGGVKSSFMMSKYSSNFCHSRNIEDNFSKLSLGTDAMKAHNFSNFQQALRSLDSVSTSMDWESTLKILKTVLDVGDHSPEVSKTNDNFEEGSALADDLNNERFSFSKYMELLRKKSGKKIQNLIPRKDNWRSVRSSSETTKTASVDFTNLNKSILQIESQIIARKISEDEAIKKKLEEERLARLAEERAKALRPLTADETEKVHCILRDRGNPDEILATSDTDFVIRKSIQTLNPGHWLNDEVIHYFLLMLSRRDEKLCEKEKGRRRSHFFKSFFITKLLDEAGGYRYQNVKRWSKKIPGKDIFALDKIIYPVNMSGVHWTCVVIFMKLKRIQFFDSMGSSGRSYLQGLLQYLEDEHKDKKKSQLDTSDWELVPCDSDSCPQQNNGFDCGVFTCMFADFISRDLPLTFTQRDITRCRDRIALSILNGSALF